MVRRAKIILAFASSLSGCSLVASFSGLTGSSLCDGGPCDAEQSGDGSSAFDATGGADAVASASDGSAASDGAGPDARAFDGGTDAPVTPITYVTSASNRIGVFNDGGVAPITSVTVTLPVAPQANDYILAMTYADNFTTSAANTVFPPTGFTEDVTPGVNPVPSGSHMAWFTRRALMGDPTAYTFTFGSSDNIAAAIIVYRGVSLTSPIDSELGALCGSTTPLPAPYNYNPTPTVCATPSITTTRSHERMVFFYGLDGSSASGPPSWTLASGMTQRESVGNVMVADVADVAVGPPSFNSSQHTQSGGYAAVKMIALEPQ